MALNYSFGSTPIQWVELNGAAGATTVINAADDLASAVNLGSNSINFYGTTYTGATSLFASSNGLITFGSGNTAFMNGDLRSSPTQAAISPFWDDYIKSAANASLTGPMVLSKIDTVHNCLILEWNHVNDMVSSKPVTFEAIIQLNTGATPGNITFNFLQLDDGKGSSASVGIKGAGSQGPNSVVVSFNIINPLVDNNQAILFQWQSPVQIPSISSLGTTSTVERSSDLTMTVNGSNFANTSVVQLSGTALATTFINTGLLQATIPAALLAEEGNFNVTVVTPGSSGGTSNAVPFLVTDAILTPSGQFLSGTEGQTLTGGLVATFTDPGSDGTAADYSATVTWDDGNGQSHTSTGAVQLVSGTTFAIYADNTVPYAEEGTYGVTISISDKGGSQATVTSEVMVADAALAASGTILSGTEGVAVSGVVATFTDADPNGALGDYTATIDWGDGQSSTGIITTGSSGGFVVSSSHTYLEEGNYTVSVVIADAGGTSTTITDSAAVADASLSAQATSISSTEGTAFSGVLATFSDADPNAALGDYTATVNWGDGQSSTGIITNGSSGGFVVSGSHTYLEEGNYAVSVAIVDAGGASVTAGSSAAIADAALTAQGTSISSPEGAFSGTVATFTDADPNGALGDYTATINWGDGQTSTGTIANGPTSNFLVSGNHTYLEEGNYTVSVVIADAGGASATASSSAAVSDAALNAQGTNISGAEGTPFSGTVATFTDADPNAVLGDYTATINWGDGQTSTGTIASGPTGNFLVSGNHTYLEEGNYAVSVVIADAGGASATVGNSAAIADAVMTAQGLSVSSAEGATVSGVMATFTDADPNGVLGDYTATVSWGDGQTSSGSITARAEGGFQVSGSHTYSEEGNYTVSVTIADVGGASVTTTGLAAVGDAPLTAQGMNVSATEGAAFSGAVASFTDANPNSPIGDFTATINWGDGQSSTGTIATAAGGGFLVSGIHAYMQEGSYSVSVFIADVGGASITASSSASVADASLSAQGTNISATEGNAFSGTVATFTDSNPSGLASDFSALISWGDGQTSSGIIGAGTGGGFVVSGGHVYADEGNYAVSVSITDAGSASATASGSAAVGDAPLTAQGINISGTEGAAFSGNVASFTDANPNGVFSDFTATINWGDGQSSNGTIGAGTGGGFVVSGSHIYADEGNYSVSVSIADVGGASAKASSSAAVGDAALTAQGTSISGTEGAAFSGTVASFTDANPNGFVGDFTATINWGDGQTSFGLIAAGPNGSFLVSGGHVYSDEGNYAVSVQISDVGGATVAAAGSATIGDAALSAQGTTITSTQGVTFSGVVATFTDANIGSPLSDFTATISWGDGSTSNGSIQIDPNGGFDVVGSHAYSSAGTDAIAIQISDVGGSSATANSIAQVAPAAPSSITAFGTSLKVSPGQSFTAVVATFTDSNPNFTAANFTAVINWGDGTSSAGVISPDGGGGFYVTGTHTYQNNGDKKVVVLIQDSAGATAEADTKIVVSNGATTTLTAQATVRHSRHHPHATLTGSFSDIASNLHKALVSWGDGTISVMDLGISNAGQFTLDHDYSMDSLDKHCGHAHIAFAVLNQEGASSKPQVLNVNFNNGHHHFSEGHHGQHHSENIWDIPELDFFL